MVENGHQHPPVMPPPMTIHQPLGAARGPAFPPAEQLLQLNYCIHSNPSWVYSASLVNIDVNGKQWVVLTPLPLLSQVKKKLKPSSKKVGFLSNHRRMNVVVTRARIQERLTRGTYFIGPTAMMANLIQAFMQQCASMQPMLRQMMILAPGISVTNDKKRQTALHKVADGHNLEPHVSTEKNPARPQRGHNSGYPSDSIITSSTNKKDGFSGRPCVVAFILATNTCKEVVALASVAGPFIGRVALASVAGPFIGRPRFREQMHFERQQISPKEVSMHGTKPTSPVLTRSFIEEPRILRPPRNWKYFVEAGAILVRLVRKKDLRYVAKATGALWCQFLLLTITSVSFIVRLPGWKDLLRFFRLCDKRKWILLVLDDVTGTVEHSPKLEQLTMSTEQVMKRMGSSPPRCEHKCYGCSPYEATQVSTTRDVRIQYSS
ncbi:Xanthine/uracil/vitamin C permease [Artemisia annua]|uniref:Xanthine/uracil/vitamin C permease n=1 Tax=Artemisia annua TaxID=35608 RepID=A0A2U1MY60_ARTAN|nr:Xanthine/uracil/vitamin C permease [Artemisia annua]